MTLSNPWFWLALLATVGVWKLEFFATLLNLSALSPSVPESLRDTMTPEEHERMLEYTRVTATWDVWQSAVSLGLFIAVWWGGGFGWLDATLAALGWGQVATGLALFAILFLAQMAVSLPFQIHDTFGIEARFGFNKTTPATFVADGVKELLLLALLGGPLLALLLWLFAEVPLAALYGFLAVAAFSLVMAFLSPRLILPLYFKIQPLDDEALRADIVALARKLGFPVGEVCMADGSRRSTKANAFFTGFGKTKRIVLFDTLLQNHSREEILAVLAHEIGHCQRRHVPQLLALNLASMGLMFAVLHFALRDPRLCAAFGVAQPSAAWGLALSAILWAPLSTLIGLVSGWLSRKFEFEADAFAREAMGSPQPLTSALLRLSRDHLSNPTPHPFYVALHYSHPPVLARVAALAQTTAPQVSAESATIGL
ncbi:MAG: M48 family metallopeptidase [Roseimicrobium sp.]